MQYLLTLMVLGVEAFFTYLAFSNCNLKYSCRARLCHFVEFAVVTALYTTAGYFNPPALHWTMVIFLPTVLVLCGVSFCYYVENMRIDAEDPLTWEEVVEPTPEEAARVRAQFAGDSKRYPADMKYIKVHAIYKIENHLRGKFNAFLDENHKDEDPCICEKYHGTAGAAAKSIIAQGFQLGRHTNYGTFGKAGYFAGTPFRAGCLCARWHLDSRSRFVTLTSPTLEGKENCKRLLA